MLVLALGIVGFTIAIVIYLLILKLINKLILKNKVKINLKEIIISWCIIFLINLGLVLNNVPFAIGIPIRPYFDAGANTYYYSLGYIIHVEKTVIYIDDEIPEPTVEFWIPTAEKLFKRNSPKIQSEIITMEGVE